MNKIPDCSKCERCKSMEYLFDELLLRRKRTDTGIWIAWCV